MNTLSERLSNLLEAHNIKAIDFSRAINVSHTTISRILNDSQKPTAENLYKFAKYFNLPMEYLLMGDDAHCICKKDNNARLSDQDFSLIQKYKTLPVSDQLEVSDFIDIKYKRAFQAAKSSISNNGNQRTKNETG